MTHLPLPLCLAVLGALAAPARAGLATETTLDDYTEQPGTFACSFEYWMFQPLSESCYHRTFDSSYLESAVLTVGSGKLELQGIIDAGEVRISTTCGPQDPALLQGCGTPFPPHFTLPLIDISQYDRFTVDFELNSFDPISIGLEAFDGTNTQTSWTDFTTPGTHTFTAPPFNSIDDTSIWTLTLVIKSDFFIPIDIELEPLMFEEDPPAPYVSETILDDFTQQPGTFSCNDSIYWLFQPLAASCHHRTFYSFDLEDPVMTVGSGRMDIQGSDFTGLVYTWTSCGNATSPTLEDCGVFFPPNWFAISPALDITQYDRLTVDFELRSTAPIRIGLQGTDGYATETNWADYDTPGTYTFTAPDFTGLDQTAIWSLSIVIEADQSGSTGPLDITLEPLVFEEDLDWISYCPAGISANGCLPRLEVHQATSTFALNFDVQALDPMRDGLFFYGINGRQMAPWGNGNSFQCVVPPVTRTPLEYSFGSNAIPCSGFANVLPQLTLWCTGCPQQASRPPSGTPVQVQFWYRDPMNTSNQTTSLSNAVEFIMP